MSHRRSRSGKPDKVTIFGVFGILALLPTAFSVAFEFDAAGLTSASTWLKVGLPFALLVATRFIPSVWNRSRAGRRILTTVAILAGAGFMWHMTLLFGFLDATPWMHYLAPVAFVVSYAAFGLIIGRAHSGPRSGHITAGPASPATSGAAARPETFSRR